MVELPSKPHSGSCSRVGNESNSLICVLPRRFGVGVYPSSQIYSSLYLVIEVSHELMMRKGGNRGLLVTTSVPGHHRPRVTKQLKCQNAALRNAPRMGKSPPAGHRAVHSRCGKAARFAVAGSLRLRLIPRQSARLSMVPIKAAPFVRNISDESRPLPATLAMARALASRRLLSSGAKTKLPIIYTADDFVLIRLHGRRAGTISVSVTGRERVGRSIRPGAAGGSRHGRGTRRDDNEYEFESRVCKDLPIPCRWPLGH